MGRSGPGVVGGAATHGAGNVWESIATYFRPRCPGQAMPQAGKRVASSKAILRHRGFRSNPHGFRKKHPWACQLDTRCGVRALLIPPGPNITTRDAEAPQTDSVPEMPDFCAVAGRPGTFRHVGLQRHKTRSTGYGGGKEAASQLDRGGEGILTARDTEAAGMGTLGPATARGRLLFNNPRGACALGSLSRHPGPRGGVGIGSQANFP